MSLRLRTFGSVYLSRDGALLSGAAAQKRLLAILTVLATVGERGITRDKLLALLWSEGEPDRSRHALTQSLYHIRKALRVEQIFLSGGDLRINPDVITSDVDDFQRALREQRYEDAVAVYGGPFLDGFYLSGDPEFDFWVSSERDRLTRDLADGLRMLAEAAQLNGDAGAELKWRARLADHDPLNGAAIASLMTCLISSGDHAGALQRARAYESRIRLELDLPPDRAVCALVATLRRPTPAGGVTAPRLTDSAAERSPADLHREEEDLAAEAPPGDREAAAAVAQTSADAPVTVVAPAALPATRPAPSASSRMIFGARRDLLIGGAASLAAIAIVTRVAASHIASDRAQTRQSTIAVAPFHVQASNATGAYLREGLVDLLSTRIADADRKRAADPARVMNAWRAAGLGGDSMPSADVVARVARELNAGEIVTGSLTTSAAGVTVHASLIDASTAKVRSSVDATGSPDSLIALTDRIISGLILQEGSDHFAELPHPLTVSPTALRAYLAGRVAYRHADYSSAARSYGRAIIQDPDFALAALGLAISADHVNAAEQHDRGLAIAWAKQDQLSPSDRAFLHAFAGPRYPSPSSAGDALAAWERVVRVAPDRAEGWYELGESFYYDGDLLGMRDALPRSAAALRHALTLDPTFTPAARMLALLLARQGDTSSLRRLMASPELADTADAMSVFVRWRAAQELHDPRELTRVRRSFDDAPNSALRSIAMTAQFDGVSVSDGDRALAILGRRALTDAELVDVALARHSRALNTGDYRTALAITGELGAYQPALHPQLRLRVLDALYSNGDKEAAQAAAAELARTSDARPPGTVADSAVRLADLCVLGQWNLSLGDTSAVRTVLKPLRQSGAPSFPVPVAANPMTCAELLDVSLAISQHGAAARDRLAHLDSLMLSGPAVGDAMRYANLVVARQYQRLGEPQRGLAALRRRSFMRGWPRYRSTGLQLQIALALASGDSAAARSAAQRLQSTRH